MLLFIRAFLILYGLIAIVTGAMGIFIGYDPTTTDAMQDNNHRFVSAIWAAMSLAFFYVAWNPSEVALFRFLMAAVIIGGIVRAVALINYPPKASMVFIILLELIPTVLMLYMHHRLMQSSAL